MKKPDQQLLDSIRDQLRAPIPEKYLKELTSGMTDINFSYQLQRMDEVFGLAGWSRKSRLISLEKIGLNGKSSYTQWEASAEAIIKIPILGRTLNQFGASSSDVKSDAMKGAVTAATSKCFQELGIGWEIYSRKPATRVWPKSALKVFQHGISMAWEEFAAGLTRAEAWLKLTEEFKAELEACKADKQ